MFFIFTNLPPLNISESCESKICQPGGGGVSKIMLALLSAASSLNTCDSVIETHKEGLDIEHANFPSVSQQCEFPPLRHWRQLENELPKAVVGRLPSHGAPLETQSHWTAGKVERVQSRSDGTSWTVFSAFPLFPPSPLSHTKPPPPFSA